MRHVSPLAAAVEFGKPAPCSDLVARGARPPRDDGGSTVRAIAAGWSRSNRFPPDVRGAVVDYAACLRILLDVGAELPDSTWRAQLLERLEQKAAQHLLGKRHAERASGGRCGNLTVASS